MFGSIQFIDYSIEGYIGECVLIGYYTKGGFTKGDLDQMPFDEFTMAVNECKRIEKLLNGEKDENNG